MGKHLHFAFLVLGATTIIHAQNEMIKKEKGWLFGASLGPAITVPATTDSHTDTDLAFDLKVGYMVKKNFAVLLTTNVSTYDYSGGYGRERKRDFGVLGPAVQYRIAPRIWLTGGAGLGVDAPVFWDIKNPDTVEAETKYFTGFGCMGGVGYEVWQGRKMSLDAKARLTYRNICVQEISRQGYSFAVTIGMSFF